MTIVFATGHRPESCNIQRQQMYDMAHFALVSHPRRVDALVCGMAAGWDLVIGQVALELGIGVIAAVPWAGHSARLPYRRIHTSIIKNAERVVYVTGASSYPGPQVYHLRNHWMVDNSDEGIALWNHKQEGGTFRCIEYAEKQLKPVRNVYDEFDWMTA